jgi:hypothetical protein
MDNVVAPNNPGGQFRRRDRQSRRLIFLIWPNRLTNRSAESIRQHPDKQDSKNQCAQYGSTFFSWRYEKPGSLLEIGVPTQVPDVAIFLVNMSFSCE